MKYYLKQIIISKPYLELLNNYFLIAFGLVIILLGVSDSIYLIFLPFILIYFLKKSKYILITFLISSSLIIVHFVYLNNQTDLKVNEITGTITEIELKETSTQITLKSKVGKFLVFLDNTNVQVGMRVYIKGENVNIDPNRIEHAFNYQAYLKHNHYRGVISASFVQVIGRTFCLEVIKAKVNSYFEHSFSGDSLTFMKALVLGDDSYFEESLIESLKINGIIHLFAISGSHIIIFVTIITSILSKLKVKENSQYIIITIFLVFYLIITSFSASIFRAALMYLGGVLSKKFKLGFSSLDVGSIVFVGLIIYNPYYIYNVGFVLSFIVSFLIILTIPLMKGGSIKQTFIISALAQVFTFPLIINLNYEINLLSPITNVIYIFMVESLILPFSIVLIILPSLQYIYNYIVLTFAESCFLFSKYFTITMRFPYLNSYIIIIYYGLVILILSFYYHQTLKRWLMIILCLFFLGLNNVPFFKTEGEVNFLDLYNGEATLITEPCGKCQALIDTGDGKNNEVTQYLKSRGIKKLNYLILTHNHGDHNGEAKNIISEIKVNKVVVSAYDNSEFTNLSNTVRVKQGDVIRCGNLKFNILHPDKKYNEENDNSIVISSFIGHYQFLFIGDISTNIEMKFAYLNIDVIKIGHHGSYTSSSFMFLKTLHPQIAIIQTGRVQKFGFPHQAVIDNLKVLDIQVYRTDLHYSIKYKYNKKRGIFKTFK